MMKRIGMVFLVAILGSGCGDDDGNAGIDAAASIDAPVSSIDAPVSTPDAPASDGAGGGDAGFLDIAICDTSAGPFSLTIDNPYFPLAVGTVSVLEGDDEGIAVAVTITVLDETETVGGVVTRVVEERETEDGDLIEVSRNYFAQAPDGTVCYFGEAVDIYEDGVVVSNEGAWRADEGQNRAGIIMPANPQVGDRYQQEDAPGVAEDRAEVEEIGETVTVPAGTFTETLRTIESTPLEPGVTSEKVYAQGVGLIVDDVVELTPAP